MSEGVYTTGEKLSRKGLRDTAEERSIDICAALMSERENCLLPVAVFLGLNLQLGQMSEASGVTRKASNACRFRQNVHV